MIDSSTPGGSIVIDPVNNGAAFANTGVMRASAGVLLLRGINGGGFDSSTGSIDIQSTGVLHMIEGANLSAGAIALNGSWTLDSNSYAVVTNFRGGGSLKLVNSSVVQLRSGGGTVGTSRAVAVSTVSNARLDLADHDLIVDYVGATPIDSIRTQLRSAYGGGTWNGATGITSGVAATSAIADGIGYVEATQIGVTNYSAQPVDDTSVLLHYTLLGDSNLDNVVNISDFSLLAANFNTAGTWYRGDYNYDGTIDIGDFALLAANFNRSLPAELPRESVPEPAAVLLLAMLGVARRRRS